MQFLYKIEHYAIHDDLSMLSSSIKNLMKMNKYQIIPARAITNDKKILCDTDADKKFISYFKNLYESKEYNNTKCESNSLIFCNFGSIHEILNIIKKRISKEKALGSGFFSRFIY